jgi:hypothetical protein
MIFEIKQGTKQHEDIEKVFHWHEAFSNPEFISEFKQRIGVKPNKNCATDTSRLLLVYIPDGSREQFCKEQVRGENCLFYAAKGTSPLNKAYLDLIKKFQIVEYRLFHFCMSNFSVDVSNGFKTFYPINDRYFAETRGKLSDYQINTMKSKDFLVEVPEHEFLRLRADFMESIEKEKAS